MHILVTAASKHGATDEVADAIARRIEASGITVDRLAPADVTSVADYDAVVVGSAVYILQWMPEAHDFMERFKDELPAGRVWAFSVGLSGLPKGRIADPRRIGPVLLSMEPKDHVTFPGRFDPSELSWRERSIARMGGASEGDFIDLDAVRGWADAIATTLIAQA